MPCVHSCCDLLEELQAWAKAVANRVTDWFEGVPETANVGFVVMGTVAGTFDDAAAGGTDRSGAKGCGLAVESGA
jgi:hypothetical protein